MRYFDHKLSREEQDLFYKHLDHCPECRNLYDDLDHILTPLEAAGPVEPDPGIEQIILEKIQEQPVSLSRPEPGLAKLIYVWVAFACILLMLAIQWTLGGMDFPQLLLQIRQYINSFSGIALDLQIIYQFIASIFTQGLVSILWEIHYIGLAAFLFGIILTIRFTAVKPANPDPEFH
jgi:hypothetical protein